MKTIILTLILSTAFCAATFAGGLRQNRSINDIYNDLINGREITHAESTDCAAAHLNSLNTINFAKVNLVTESNIDDFPYDTEIIANGYKAKLLVSGMELSDENEVQDFPYDTEVIANGMISMKAFAGMKLAEEQYVNDVPFDTAKIASKLMNAAE